MMFDTKIALILREDLLFWQKLNVTAFLTSGIVAKAPDIVGEAYRDADGNLYNPLLVQPVIVLTASQELMSTIHRRALEREVPASAFIEEMFATGHDAANRAVFSEHAPATAKIVGLGLRADRKIIDKIVKGAAMHK